MLWLILALHKDHENKEEKNTRHVFIRSLFGMKFAQVDGEAYHKDLHISFHLFLVNILVACGIQVGREAPRTNSGSL